MALTFGGAQVRCAPYVTFGTPDLADLAAVAAMQDRTACLLSNHGMITAGRDARHRGRPPPIELERLCRQYLLARAAGTPPPAQSAAQLAQDAQERFRTYQQDKP